MSRPPEADGIEDGPEQGGRLGALIRESDWSSSPLGDPGSWSQSLKTTVALMLGAQAEIVLFWGPRYVALYNDAYAPTIGTKHPGALGRPAVENWTELWDDLEPLLRGVRETGKPFSAKDRPFYIERQGYGETVYFDVSYSLVPEADGGPGGVLCIVSETTTRVRAERVQVFRLALEERLRKLSDPRDVMQAAVDLLGPHLGANRVGYGEVQPDDATVVLHSCFADGVAPLAGAFALDGFGPESIAAQRRGETQWSSDLSDRTGAERDVWAAIETRAFASLPLLRDGRFAASLYVNFREAHVWTPDEIGLLEEVASRTWAAVERVRAETALRENEGELRFALEAGRFGAWRLDLATGEMATSSICRLNFGRHAADPFSYADLRAAIHPDDRARMSDAVDSSLATGGLYDIEYRITTPAGEPRWVQIRGRPLQGPDGQIREMAGVSIDVTERKAAEERLQASEARYRQIVEGTEDFAIVTLDERGSVTGWNTGAERIIGLREDEALGRTGAIIFTPEDREAGVPDREMHRARDEGRAPDERWHLRKDGSRFWGSGLMIRLDQPGGGFLKIFRDRTAEHQAEAALRESEAQLRFLRELETRLFGAADAFAAMGAAAELLGRRLRASRCAYADVDVDNDRFWIRSDYNAPGVASSAGLYSLDLFGPRAAADMRAGRTLVVRDVAAELGPGDGRETFQAIGIEAIICCPLVNDGGLAAMMAVHQESPRDWTPAEIALVREVVQRCWAHVERVGSEARLRESEERLRLANATLEERIATAVAEREAAQDALRQAQKMEAMGQLTGGVAHDFNNLLTPIVGSLDMLQRKGLGNEREQRLIAGAMQSAERAKTLVQRLLAFARRQPLQPVAVDLARLIHAMGDLVASTTGPQIRVVVDAPDDLPHAMADPNQVEMAVINLSVNARDAMPDGGTLRISASADSVRAGYGPDIRPGRYIRLSVADTGTGMDEATLARAVEPFFSTKAIGKGTGLGLSMAHGLAAQLGGALTIQSRRGVGTNVELWLPISPALAEPVEAVSGPARQTAVAGTALLVDDEELVRMSTAHMLGDLGYEVVEAASAEEAMDLIGKGLAPTLLVTDHLMPGMNGTELARALRSDRPGLKVLVLSGYAEDEGVAPDLPRLTKPFRRDELTSSLAGLEVAGAGEQGASLHGVPQVGAEAGHPSGVSP